MSERTPDACLDLAEKLIRSMYFEAKADVMPMLHLFFKDGENAVIAIPFRSREEKVNIAAAIKHKFAGQVEAFMFISEAWTLKAPKENSEEYINQAQMEYTSFGEHPDRIEVVFVTYEDAKIAKERFWHIERGEDGFVKNLDEQKGFDSFQDFLWEGLIAVS